MTNCVVRRSPTPFLFRCGCRHGGALLAHHACTSFFVSTCAQKAFERCRPSSLRDLLGGFFHRRAMDQGDHSRTPRNHRGGRSLITVIARLPTWARDLYNQFKDESSPRALRQVLAALRTLLHILEGRLAELETLESQATAAGSAHGRSESAADAGL